MADFTHYEFQLRQRLTSTAFNTAMAYLGRHGVEMVRHMLLNLLDLSGVVNGLLVTVAGGDMTFSVSDGLAFYYDNTVPDTDSRYRVISVESTAPLQGELDPGDVQPRWDIVEIAPGFVDGAAQNLDFYDPSTGAFTNSPASPLKVSAPSMTVRKGTPAALPKLPAGTAGVIPLAYIYVPAGAVSLSATQVLYCRPILRPEPFANSPSLAGAAQTRVRGGGWNIAADGFAGTCPGGMTGHFVGHGSPFQIAPGTAVTLAATSNWEGGGIPVADTHVHMYAAPAPYPAGHDANLAGRELQCSDASLLWGGYASGMLGCIVVGSSVAPTYDANGNPTGGGNFSMVAHNLWGTISIPRNKMLYLGSAYFVAAIPGLAAQRVRGKWVAPSRKTGFQFHADLPIVGVTQYNMWDGFAGTAMKLPTIARILDVDLNCGLAPGGDLRVVMEDQWTGQGTKGRIYSDVVNLAATIEVVGQHHVVEVDSSGNLIIMEGTVQDLDGQAEICLRAYEDGILAMR